MGGLYLLAKGKVDLPWYSSSLPTLFYLSAVPAGLAPRIMAAYLCNRSLHARVDHRVLSEMSQISAPLLYSWARLRVASIYSPTAEQLICSKGAKSFPFWLEITFFVPAPVCLLSQSLERSNPQALYAACALVGGFMANRLNDSMTAFQAVRASWTFPTGPSSRLGMATVAAAGVVFHYAVKHLEILPEVFPRKTR